MGKFNSSGNSQIWQQVSGALPSGIWSTPAYFNGTVYYGEVGATLKAFAISGRQADGRAAIALCDTICLSGYRTQRVGERDVQRHRMGTRE